MLRVASVERHSERAVIVERGDHHRAAALAVRPRLPWREIPAVEEQDDGLHGPERHALHLYQVRLAPGLDRDAIVAALQARSIGVAVHYIGVNLHPYYAPRHPEALPHSDAASLNLISLPLHPGLAEDDLIAVVTALQEEIAAQEASTAHPSVPAPRVASDRPLAAGRSLR